MFLTTVFIRHHSAVYKGTSAPGLGMRQPCGHLDFYPNGGRDQPGCDSYAHTLTSFLEGSLDDFESELFACRHIRAVRIFTDSIIQNPDCSFVGHECKNFDEFMKVGMPGVASYHGVGGRAAEQEQRACVGRKGRGVFALTLASDDSISYQSCDDL